MKIFIFLLAVIFSSLAFSLSCPIKSVSSDKWLVKCDLRQCIVINSKTKKHHPKEAEFQEHITLVTGVPDDCEDLNEIIKALTF